jgi:Protein of unknown function (DUF2786)
VTSKPHSQPDLDEQVLSEKISRAIQQGVLRASPKVQGTRAFTEVVDALLDADGIALEHGGSRSGVRPYRIIESEVLGRMGRLWESGWQPLDLIHVVRRETSPRVALLGICSVIAESENSPHRQWQPSFWAQQVMAVRSTFSSIQLARLASSASDLDSHPFEAWLHIAPANMAELIDDGIVLLGALRVLHPISVISEVPSRWQAAASRTTATASVPAGDQPTPETSSKTLATIRSLLAKAEATTFPAEADSFAEKAQELMTKHSIDIAMLDVRHGDDLAAGVVARRFHIEQPYAKEKVVLLATVGSVNRVRVVFDEAYGLANAVGFVDDIDVTDLLFTSLLVQAARAVVEVAPQDTKKRRSGRASHHSSPSFRRAFWLSYAGRIAERLEEAHQRATTEGQAEYGAALVPVLQERSEAVNARVDEMFPKVRAMKSKSVDAEGWWAGRDAADRASLNVAKGRIRK